MDNQKYYDRFEGENLERNPKITEALRFAIDVRQFEIELYWRRAAYFWAFAAVALGAYLAASGSNITNKPEVQLLVSCVGLVFAWAWYLVNRASKFWQLNWEHHVDLLEDHHMGPIYKTVLDPSTGFWQLAGPLKVSASKINHLLSLFVAFVFLALLGSTLSNNFTLSLDFDLLPTLLLPLTATALWGLLHFSKQDDKDKATVRMNVRTITVSVGEEQLDDLQTPFGAPDPDDQGG